MTGDQQHEIRRILAEMSVISEAPGASFILSGVTGTKKKTVSPTLRDGDEPLLDKWAPRFADPANAHRLPTLILLAQRELTQRKHRSPTPIGEHGEREDSWERDSRIVEWYADVPADEASIIESASGTHCSAANIRKVRRRNDLDAERGLPQAPPEHRQRIARELKSRGLKIREIAREMNVSEPTVKRALYTERPDDLAA